MTTFIKKLNRNSEFVIVIPEDVKTQYGLVVDQIVSFEVSRRDTGAVVLHKEVAVSDVEGDTEIVFSSEDLETSDFVNDTVYDYKIVAYLSDDNVENNLDTQYFDTIQMITQNVFGMGEE